MHLPLRLLLRHLREARAWFAEKSPEELVVEGRAEPEELAQLMKKILSDRSLKLRLQDKALRLGKSWTWNNVGKQYVKLSQSILRPEPSVSQDGGTMSYAR